MEIVFQGRARSVYAHAHDVKRLRWTDAKTLRGAVDDLGLSGNFNFRISFETDELVKWLKHFIQEEPDQAVKLLGQLHSEAIVSLFYSRSSKPES